MVKKYSNKYNNKEWLFNQYIILKRSCNQIAKEVGCTNVTISKWLAKFSIPKRTLLEAIDLCHNIDIIKFRNKEWLEEQYIFHRKSYEQIEREFNIEKNTICHWMKEFGIKARNCSESHLGKKYNISEDVLRLRGERISKALTGKLVGDKNPFYGKHHTEETKQHLSKIPRISGKDHPRYGKPAYPGSGHGNGAYFTKSNNVIIWLRSSYEILFATELEKQTVAWEYEKRIELQNDIIWHPDFYLPEYDLYVEVKGYLTDDSKQKMIMFNNKYPDKKLIVLQYDDIIKFLYSNEPITSIGIPLNEYLISKNVIQD